MATASTSLKEYLRRYQSSPDDQTKRRMKNKKKKKNDKSEPTAGVLVVDEDPVWQKPIAEEEEEESADNEAPQINEDIEVKRLKRLEAIRSLKPYNAISEDGSGWVSISDQPKKSSDHSSSRHGRPPRCDAPSPGDREQQKIEEDSGDGDLSPPHPRRHRRLDTPSPEPDPRATNSDLSPSQRKSVEDLSPPRRNRNRSAAVDCDDLLPPRKSCNRLPDVDLSPPRKRKETSLARDEEDLSRQRKKHGQSLAAAKEETSRRTGLLSAGEIRQENEKKRKDEILRFASMDASVSGKGAEVVFRDKEGRRIRKEDLLKAHEEEKPKEKKLEWGKGLVQKREAKARVKELELEKDKPFARTRDDPDLDKMLKERIRWGDPMAHLVKNSAKEPIFEDLGTDEKMKESGFIIPQSIPSYSWIKRGIDFPPNRYGIRPGRHWDGVDRSNGYERELFKRQNEKQATDTEAYLWSVSDM